MKKFATIVMMIAVMAMMAIPVLASQSPDYSTNSKYEQYDTDQKFKEVEERLSEKSTALWYNGHNVLLSWYIKSVNNHRGVIARRHIFKGVYPLHTDNVDFIEFGRLYESKTEDEIEAVKQDFEKDPVDSALKFIIPSPVSESEEFEQYTSELRKEIEKIPVYWNVKTMKWDPNFYVIEVAIGKYVIQQGDTLSKIAEKFDTSVEEILRKNFNIEDQNHIEAGNYLCIW